MPITTEDIQAASAGNPAAKRLLEKIVGVVNFHIQALGVDPLPSQSARPDQQLNIPPAGDINVTGANGHFYVTLTPRLPGIDKSAGSVQRYFNPNPRFGDPWGQDDARRGRAQDLTLKQDGRRGGRLLHQLQSSTTLLFDNAGSVTTYGPSEQIRYDILDPNQQKFWRFRSRLQHSDYNNWTYFVNPTTCGPVQVDSLLLSTAATVQLNGSNTPTTQPVTQVGTSTSIAIANFQMTNGNAGTISYTGGTVNPGVFGTFYIYALDPQRKGGTVPYTATTVNPDVTNNDNLVYIGKITTSGAGGGVGGGGGNGPCCIHGVLVEMADGSLKDVAELRRGDALLGVDGGKEIVQRVELIPNVPCFRFETEQHILQGCSALHTLKGAHYQHAHLFHVGEDLLTASGMATITKKEFIGNHTVYKLTLSHSKTYWTDGFASHNLLK